MLISLDWQRPLDGVEVVKASEVLPKLLTESLLIRGKTTRTAPLTLRVSSLENPVAIQLANADTLEKLCDFVARFGVPDRLGYNSEEEGVLVDLLEAIRDDVVEGLDLLNRDDDAARVDWSSRLLEKASLHPALEYSPDDKRQRLALKASGLSDLMLCEVAHAMEAQARLQRCAHCEEAFLTGHLTGRRATATYCSDRCRTAAMRARKSND